MFICAYNGSVQKEPGIEDAAQLFKVLGNGSRLWILLLLEDGARTVGTLAEETGMSQPLVSQYLRALRQAGLVRAVRTGKEAKYHVSDAHVTHLVADALAHVSESDRHESGKDLT